MERHRQWLDVSDRAGGGAHHLARAGAVPPKRVLYRAAGRAGQERDHHLGGARAHRVSHDAPAAAQEWAHRSRRLAEGRGRGAECIAARELVALRQRRGALLARRSRPRTWLLSLCLAARRSRSAARHHHSAVRAARRHVRGRGALCRARGLRCALLHRRRHRARRERPPEDIRHRQEHRAGAARRRQAGAAAGAHDGSAPVRGQAVARARPVQPRATRQGARRVAIGAQGRLSGQALRQQFRLVHARPVGGDRAGHPGRRRDRDDAQPGSSGDADRRHAGAHAPRHGRDRHDLRQPSAAEARLAHGPGRRRDSPAGGRGRARRHELRGARPARLHSRDCTAGAGGLSLIHI